MSPSREGQELALRGWATFAWQSDYGQFYLIDCEDEAFRAPVEITAEMERRRVVAPASGLVVYTEGCLQQHIRISIHDAEPDHPPAEPMGGEPWTQIETIRARLPSRRFTLSSPSMPDPLPAGPHFIVDTDIVIIRVHWMEFQGSRDDSVPVAPDVIEITIWPG
ncbi:hypothetical protein [Muricoccus radiodurans]|uniref:hypothetical protein n=1 Tax=Muricoccus radiodurans TaxID=2231721 RepID=UPI003CF8CCBD